ncbi:hypothetical protein EVAR_54104_1, partial [Eumeta japonica]
MDGNDKGPITGEFACRDSRSHADTGR